MKQQKPDTRCRNVMRMLLSGKPVPKDEFKQKFSDMGLQDVFYKLSYYILQAKHQRAIIKTHRNGVRVTAYQLMNADKFDINGFYKEEENAVG